MEYNGCMATAAERSYTGQELELFALATNWKRYVKAQIGKYLIGDVLEIGAGSAAQRWRSMMAPRTDGYALNQMPHRRNGCGLRSSKTGGVVNLV